jgi:Transposase DNA-binding/Transposase Tn5 dimerisation domain/Transposase DDE domain
MVASWAVEEMAGVDLNDGRLNKRVTQLLSDLGARPTASIPAACGGHTEMTAAYRFFDNDKATYAKILEPHEAKTRERVRAQKVVLCVQDTSEIELTRPQQQVVGAGPLAAESRQGIFLHLLEAFTPDGTPLGGIWSHTWARDEAALQTPPPDKRKQRKAAPIEAKESFRWLQGLRHTRALAEECPDVTCVSVADSESDIYELFAEPRGATNPVHWLIRLCQDRALAVDPEEEEAALQARLIRAGVAEAPVLFTKEIAVRGRTPKVSCEDRGRRQPRQDRPAVVEVRAATLTLRPPSRPDRQLPEVTVNVVWVREVNPPANDVPVEWLLVTTLPIDDAEQVREIIQYYCIRWMIEVLFRTLKSGCRVEERRLERVERLERCLAVYEIVAWRTLYVCRLGRSCPDLDCEAVFEPSEWQSVWMAVHRQSPPQKPPRLAEMVRLIAQLGGYVNRPNREDPPGPQTVWLGLQRMRDLVWGWDTFGPGAKKVV